MSTCMRTLLLAAGLAFAAGAAPRAFAAAPAPPPQQHFASPEEASTTLVAAAKAADVKGLLAVLGAKAKPVVDSGDPVADREAFERFVQAYEEANKITKSGDAQAELVVGKDDWPFPLPLVKEADGWRFDTSAGSQEILDRRIGRNELATIQSCLAIVDAQREYYSRNPENAPLLHYARRFQSTPGKRDGLYWPSAEGEPESPLGPLFAQARAEGYRKSSSGPTPYHGYVFRILDAQGPHADGGAYSYVAKGQLIGGFAVVAYPATWGSSGVMTFLVNHDGVVFEKDLGPKTGQLARAMTRFDPDETWKRVSDEEEKPPQEAAR